MLSNVIVVLLGLTILDGVGCLPISNSIESGNTNTISPRNDAPLDTSSVHVNSLKGTVGLVVIDGPDDLPIVKKGHGNNGRGNPSSPATLDYDVEDTTIGKRDTPSLIGARDKTSASPLVTHSDRREFASLIRAKNTFPPATLEEQDPEITDDLSSLTVAPLQVVDTITRRSEVDGLSVSSADDSSPPVVLTVGLSATNKGFDTSDAEPPLLQDVDDQKYNCPLDEIENSLETFLSEASDLVGIL